MINRICQIVCIILILSITSYFIFMYNPNILADFERMNISHTERIDYLATKMELVDYMDVVRMCDKIVYKKDPINIDIQSYPEVTWTRGYGDCDDYTKLHVDMLKFLGYKDVYTVSCYFANNTGHIFVMMKYNNYYHIFDCNFYTRVKIFFSMKKIAYTYLGKTGVIVEIKKK